MRFLILLFSISFQICASAVLFQIKSANNNVSINSSYLFGTAHVAQNLIWPYLSNETIQILTKSDEMWMEHDFTDPRVGKHIYGCSFDKLTNKQRARLRTRTWSQFLNETKRKSTKKSSKSQHIKQWRQWLINKRTMVNQYLWRNKTISDDIIFDHRIILEGYRRGIHVGSLEPIPNDCSMITSSKNITSSRNTTDLAESLSKIQQQLISHMYNCEMIDENFVNLVSAHLGIAKLKKRNEQITQQIRKILKKNPQKKYVFAVGAAHLFGNVSVVHMLRNRYKNHYNIEQIDAPSPNYASQFCTEQEFNRILNEVNPVINKTIVKRFIDDESFEQISTSLFN